MRKLRIILILFAVENWHRVPPGIPEDPWMQQTQSNCSTNPCIQNTVWSRLSIETTTSRVCSSGNSRYPHIYTTFILLQNSVYHRLLRLPCGCRASWINSWFLRMLVSCMGGRKLSGFTTIHLVLLIELIVPCRVYSLKIKEGVLY